MDVWAIWMTTEGSVYITRGLLDALLELAAENEPEELVIDLESTPAHVLELPFEEPILTHLSLPEASASLHAVFGWNVGTTPGRTHGRFIAHPSGDLTVRATDDLHARLLIAIPPWNRTSVAAFDRSGSRKHLSVLDVDPPVEKLP